MELVLAIPTFNAAAYLAETLESLNRQSAPVRWWLQDGGSTDATLEIARRFQRPQDTIVSVRDGGQADALNQAMGKMGGDVIGFINGDDRLHPGTAEAVLKSFRENPLLDLVYGEVLWINSQGAETGRHAGRIDSLEEILDLYHVWWRQRQWVQPEVFYRRTLWERTGGFDTRYHLAFDYDFWIRCFQAGARVRRIPRPFAEFRLHPQQKSSAADRAASELRTILHRHLPPGSSRLRWQLDYGRYHNGEMSDAPSSFFSALLQNPGWLTLPKVWERLLYSASFRINPS